MIKAIETEYKGYRFRSRLEARWAVFFDTLNLDWVYEPEGFDLGEAGRYLPDFWIDYGTDNQYWIEVKAHKNLSDREYSVATALSEYYPGFVALGQPELPVYNGPFSALFLEEITSNTYKTGSWHLPFAKFERTGPKNEALHVQYAMQERMFCWHEYMANDEGLGSYKLWPVPACEPALLDDPNGFAERMKDGWVIIDEAIATNPVLAGNKSFRSEHLIAAYDAARRAQFEFGRNGAR